MWLLCKPLNGYLFVNLQEKELTDLTQGKEGKLIFNFAIPMLIGNVFQQLYNIIDSAIVGRYLGKEALAAVGASFPLIFLLLSLIIGIGMGSSVIISQYYGAKDLEKVSRAIDTMYIFLFFASILLTALGIIFSESVFRWIKLPEEVIPQAKIFFNVYLSGLVFFFGFNGTSSVLRGLGDSKTPLYFLIFSTLLNIALVFLFVVGFSLGIGGAALATVVSQALAFLLTILYLNKHHEIVKLSLRKISFDKTIFKQTLKIGLPTGLQQSFVALGMIALLSIVNKFGTNAVAAYSVAGRIDSFASLPSMNFAAALTAFVGQNIGANKHHRVRNGLISTLKMTAMVSIFISIVVLLFGENIMSVFTHDPEVIRMGEQYLIIVSSFYMIFSSMFVIGSVMRGAGDTLVPMFISLLSLWLIRIPLAYILSSKFGPIGIWWSIPMAWFVGLILSYLYYLSGRWKNKSVVKVPSVDIIAEIET